MALTPMLSQYFDIKKQHEDCVLFFRLGDFYEMFGKDALIAAPILDIALTKRNKGTPNEIPMCGVPHHSANQYISKLTRAGKKVAVCEQISDASLPGIVKREVVRVITPGTTLDSDVLESKSHNYLIALVKKQYHWGLAKCDISTGHFSLTEFDQEKELVEEVYKIAPSEIVISHAIESYLDENNIFSDIFVACHESSFSSANTYLKTYFCVQDLSSFGIASYELAIQAAALLLSYAQETQKTKLAHIHPPSYYHPRQGLLIDESTYRNLEIFSSVSGKREPCLFSVIDHSITSMGSRLLFSWFLRPLIHKNEIDKRLQSVDFFVKNISVSKELTQLLSQIHDISRLTGKLGAWRINPVELLHLSKSLRIIPDIKSLLQKTKNICIEEVLQQMEDVSDIAEFIDKSIHPHASISLQQDGYIHDGYNKEIDEYRHIMTSGKDIISKMQEQERKNTGIQSLKIKFNKVFGYYIEISKANLSQVPSRYMRKQTLVNAERFITQELKEYEHKVLTAQEKLIQLEFTLYQEILTILQKHISRLRGISEAIAYIDVINGFALLASKYQYVKPELTNDSLLEIQAGRHPVIECLMDDAYIPNDLIMDMTKRIIVLTGPNMAGKSSYLRQNALIILLAHIGCFVPAKKALIPIMDRIFSRVGASDNLAKGQSTFMVEMQETANILHNATDKSFIILDELGRGTSTYDGVSIAMSVTKYLHEQSKAFVLFATHYHELITFAQQLDGAKNYSVFVKENEKEGVVFLYTIVEGGTDKSYGIEVAKLAGIPQEVIKQAYMYLEELSAKNNGFKQESLFQHHTQEMPKNNISSNISGDNKIRDAFYRIEKDIHAIDTKNITPLQALLYIEEWQNKIKKAFKEIEEHE